MLDFNLKPYEWQKNMNTIMQNVNLDKIVINGNFTIIFDFLNSEDGDTYKKIACYSVWKLSSDMDISEEDEFPFFVCDIKTLKLESSDVKSAFTHYGFGFNIPESDEYNLLCMESGDISINLICKKIEILEYVDR